MMKKTYKLLKNNYKIEREKTMYCNYPIIFILWNSNAEQPNASKNLTTTLLEFYHLWPLNQWISSLLGLIVLYLITGSLYNRLFSQKGGWLDWRARIWLIISDLAINLVLGLYFMSHRETLLGLITIRCPLAFSPAVFILELVCVYMYYRFGAKKN